MLGQRWAIVLSDMSVQAVPLIRTSLRRQFMASLASPLSVTNLHPLKFTLLSHLQFSPNSARNRSSTQRMWEHSSSVSALAHLPMANRARYVIERNRHNLRERILAPTQRGPPENSFHR